MQSLPRLVKLDFRDVFSEGFVFTRIAANARIAAVNPLVGAGTWLAQRLLGDPLGQILAFEYHITGSWREPQVQKVRRLLPTGRKSP